MTPKKLPEHFPAPTVAELRQLWRKYRDDPTLQRVLMEIERVCGSVDRIEAFRESIDRVWKDEGLGNLAGLYQLRILLAEERRRAGRLGP